MDLEREIRYILREMNDMRGEDYTKSTKKIISLNLFLNDVYALFEEILNYIDNQKPGQRVENTELH